MIDRALDIFLMLLFGIGGMTILILAWVQPMSITERTAASFVGSIGLFWVLIRLPLLKSKNEESKEVLE